MNLIENIKKQVAAIPADKAKTLGSAVAIVGLFSMGLMAKNMISSYPRHRTGQECEGYVETLKSREMEWLARNIYHEARGESWEGMLAVGIVTLNRLNSPDYPDSIEEVVKDYKQFSWFWDGKSDKVRNRRAWRKAKAAAAEVMMNPDLPLAKKLEGVMYYHADYVSPYWASNKQEVATIGKHVFYM